MGGFVRPLAVAAMAASVAVGGCASLSGHESRADVGKGIVAAQAALDLAVNATDAAVTHHAAPRATLIANAVVLHTIDGELTQARATWTAGDTAAAAAHLAGAVALTTSYKLINAGPVTP